MSEDIEIELSEEEILALVSREINLNKESLSHIEDNFFEGLGKAVYNQVICNLIEEKMQEDTAE